MAWSSLSCGSSRVGNGGNLGAAREAEEGLVAVLGDTVHAAAGEELPQR